MAQDKALQAVTVSRLTICSASVHSTARDKLAAMHTVLHSVQVHELSMTGDNVAAEMVNNLSNCQVRLTCSEGHGGMCTYHVKNVFLHALALMIPTGPVVTRTPTMI